MTLIGKRDGYSMSDCSAGMSCMRVSIATIWGRAPPIPVRGGAWPSDRLRQLGALVRLVEARVHGPGLAAQGTVADALAVEGRHGQDFLGRGAEQDLVRRGDVGLGDLPQV